MACPCQAKKMTETKTSVENGVSVVRTTLSGADRSGACESCLAKHIIKAIGYTKELREDPSRAWERERLVENLALAEDHAAALGIREVAARIRAVRLRDETQFDASALVAELEGITP